jgi:hypothetical protein
MMEGVAARLLCWQRGLTGWHEARQLVHSHTGESQDRSRAGPQARAGSTSQRGGLLASEASWTINRDKLSSPDQLHESGETPLLHPALQRASPSSGLL